LYDAGIPATAQSHHCVELRMHRSIRHFLEYPAQRERPNAPRTCRNYCVTPNSVNINAYRRSDSFIRSYLPLDPPCPPCMLIKNTSGFESVLTALSFATYFEGSQYITCESSNEVCPGWPDTSSLSHCHTAGSDCDPGRGLGKKFRRFVTGDLRRVVFLWAAWSIWGRKK
jgi:hypothetical protein